MPSNYIKGDEFSFFIEYGQEKKNIATSENILLQFPGKFIAYHQIMENFIIVSSNENNIIVSA